MAQSVGWQGLEGQVPRRQSRFGNFPEEDYVRLFERNANPNSMRNRVRIGTIVVAAVILTLTLLSLQPEWMQAAPFEAGKAAFTHSAPSLLATHLYEIQVDVVELEEFPNRGGAIEPLRDGLIVATPRGRLALIEGDGQVEYLRQRVPMNESASEKPILWTGFRVADILLHERETDIFTLFVSHHYFTEECVEFRISSISLRTDDTSTRLTGSWKTELIVSPCIDSETFNFAHRGGIQAGGRMLMDGPEHLLIVTGDHAYFEWYQEEHPLEPPPVLEEDAQLGVLLRIELESGDVEIVAGGFRNPQGFVRDGEGNLWQTEHGPHGGDELNLLKPGLNYGWPFVTHGIQYGFKVWPYNVVQGRHEGYEKPVFAWIPAIGISNLVVSDSRHFPLWKGDLLIAGLISQSLYRVRLNEGHVMYVENIEIGVRIRDITQMPDGRLALLTDSAEVLFLQRAPLYCQIDNDAESIYAYDSEDVCIDLTGIIAAAEDPLIGSLSDAHFDRPVVRSLYSIFIEDGRLTYVKSPCAGSDLDHRFFLHITPADPENLVEENEHLGFNVLDFNTDEDGVGATMHRDGCIVTLALPEYDLDHIYTGQVIRVEHPGGEITWEGPVWEASYTFGEEPAPAAEGGGSPYAQGDAENPSPGAELFAARCGSCHNLAGEHQIGPHLDRVIGRRAGEVAGFNATAALTALEIAWTRESLTEFIINPAEFAPGTTMAGVGVTEEEALLIVEFLAGKQ